MKLPRLHSAVAHLPPQLSRWHFSAFLLLGIILFPGELFAQSPAASGTAIQSSPLQDEIDQKHGTMIYVGPGDHEISRPLRITTNHTGLYGPGRIIQTDTNAAIIIIENATDVRLSDLTLTRPEGRMDTPAQGIRARRCENLTLSNLQVLDNRTGDTAIYVGKCYEVKILNCLVRNYMRVSVDDRTHSPEWGFAFRVINGTGIVVEASRATLIQGNQIIETALSPTPEMKERYGLGKFTKKNRRKGTLPSLAMWDAEYYNAWHQGSGLVIGSPELSDYTQILGNYIENAAQGLDIHGHHVIVANNIVNDSFMGMKAMHGAKNVLIMGNQFSKSALWAIGLMPGAGSHAAGDPTARSQNANIDGYSIVANNIISDFGYGSSAWMWKNSDCYPLRFEKGQLPSNPRLTSVLVQGNVVYDTGRDKILVDGKPQVMPPRYKYSVFVNDGPQGPLDLHFSNNLLHPGTDGESNVPLKP
jgi:hypothetical protein